MRSLLCISFLFLLLGCNPARDERQVALLEFRPADRIPELSSDYMLLSVPDDIRIGSVDKVERADGRMFVLQTSSSECGLFVFDAAGDYVTRIGRRGRGTGEYHYPATFAIGGRYVYILDAGTNHVLRYDRESFAYVDRIKVFNTTFFEIASDDCMICGNDETDPAAPFCDKQYVSTDSLFGRRTGMVDRLFVSGFQTGPDLPIYRYGGHVRAFTQHAPRIYEFTADGATPVYELRFEGFDFPSADFMRRISAGGADYYDDLRTSGYISYYRVFETSRQLLAIFYANKIKYMALYSKAQAAGVHAPASEWQRAIPCMASAVGCLDDRFVVPLLVGDLREMEGDALPAALRATIDGAHEQDVVLWSFESR